MTGLSLDSQYAAAKAPFVAEAQRMRPEGAQLIDAHTHLGLDEDGRSLALEALLEMLDVAGVSRACTFPLHDPARRPAYSVPNDRVLGWAAESGGRLTPFCRLDPFEDPLAEGERCLAAGARGIKLHPRAQAFTFDGGELEDALAGIFGLAEQARVPILIHAGRGLPPIAEGLTEIAMRHPEVVLILAHGAICDQGVLTRGLAEHPGVLYDTSCFFPVDLIALMARVAPERVVFASDPPYGRPAGGLYLALRVAAQAGLDDAQMRLLLGGTMARLLDEGKLPQPTAPRGSATLSISTRLARVYGYASTAGPALFTGLFDRASEAIEMALGAAREPDAGEDTEALEMIRPALEVAVKMIADEDMRFGAIDLMYHVMVKAATQPSSAR